MTERIFTKGDIVYKLECRLSLNLLNSGFSYLFKLMQRGKGKRKWQDIKGYEWQYRATTDMKDILNYLTEDEVMGLAIKEYNSYCPQKEFIFNEQ